MTPHGSGKWCEGNNGKLHYLGNWARRKNGKLICVAEDGRRDALEVYKFKADDLHASRLLRGRVVLRYERNWRW